MRPDIGTRAGRRGRRGAAEGGPYRGPAAVTRYAGLLGAGQPPTAADGARLCRMLPPASFAASTLPQRLTDGLVAAARGPGIGPDQEDLAATLGSLALQAALPSAVAAVADTVALGAWFRADPPATPDTANQAVAAVRAAGYADRAVAAWTLRTIVSWLLRQPSTLFHAPLLLRLVRAAGAADLLGAYGERLDAVLRTAEPPMIAVILPALVVLADEEKAGSVLLDSVGREALAGRRSRDLDLVGLALTARNTSLMVLKPGTAASWPAWWQSWRRELTGRPAGLFRRRSRSGGP